MLRLWGRTNSINVMKVLWTLEELGLPHEQIDAGMQFGIVNTDEYRAINPNSRVPTIEEDGFTLFESNTIVRYLCAKYSMGALYPVDLRARADTERWMDWATAQVQPVMTPVFWNLIRTPAEKRNDTAVAENTAATNRVMEVLDWALTRRPYLGGDSLTIGDIAAGVWVHRWYALPIKRQDLPRVRAYYERLQERSAYRLHVAQPLS
jgi:glutathione S-transferase